MFPQDARKIPTPPISPSASPLSFSVRYVHHLLHLFSFYQSSVLKHIFLTPSFPVISLKPAKRRRAPIPSRAVGSPRSLKVHQTFHGSCVHNASFNPLSPNLKYHHTFCFVLSVNSWHKYVTQMFSENLSKPQFVCIKVTCSNIRYV